ncbi:MULTISPECIES: hypothetical protein [Nostoc]|nr:MULTISPECIES: hypothetical protein [Nostoc]
MVKQLVVEVFSYELGVIKAKLFDSQLLARNYFLLAKKENLI